LRISHFIDENGNTDLNAEGVQVKLKRDGTFEYYRSFGFAGRKDLTPIYIKPISRFPDDGEDYSKLKTYEKRFFYTKDELVELIERLFIESGGEAEWRMLSVRNHENWNLKYLRIHRTELGFLICDSDSRAVNKDDLKQPIIQKYLSTH